MDSYKTISIGLSKKLIKADVKQLIFLHMSMAYTIYYSNLEISDADRITIL